MATVNYNDIADSINSHISGLYSCTRVWDAWQVGTMSESDFELVGNTDIPYDLTMAICDLLESAGVKIVGKMAREILFRGFSENINEWVYGDLTHSSNGVVKVDQRIVISETVGQFIDQHDHDGKRIFEGDIVLWGKVPAVCVFDKKSNWVFRNKLADFAVFGYANECRVIGNIHDNPELLK